MHIKIEIKDLPDNLVKQIPKSNIFEFSQLLKNWGLADEIIEKLQIRITFCNTPYRGEYLGCDNGIHNVELLNFYCRSDMKLFLEKITVRELRHLWWALHNNSPIYSNKDDCRKIVEETAATNLWSFD